MKAPKVSLNSRSVLPKYTDEQLTAMAASIGLTLEDLKAIHAAMHRTYQYIGADLAAVSPKGIKRYDLTEVVLDAGRVQQDTQLTPTQIEWLNTKATKYPLPLIYQVLGSTFAYPIYE